MEKKAEVEDCKTKKKCSVYKKDKKADHCKYFDPDLEECFMVEMTEAE